MAKSNPANKPAAALPLREGIDPPKHIVEFAVEIAGQSPCRSQRGVVIFNGGEIISHGHNFKPRPFPCDGSAECKQTCRRDAVHAEQMALLCITASKARDCEMLHVKAVDGKLVPSGPPSCVECSKLAMAAGIGSFWLFHEDGWKRYDMAEFHRFSLQSVAVPAPRRREGQWQPIETAPKDGTPILACCRTWTHPYVFCYLDGPDLLEGWHDFNISPTGRRPHVLEMWQPLPAVAEALPPPREGPDVSAQPSREEQ